MDDGFLWGYLFGRYDDGITGLLRRLNRRSRGALAAFFIGFCLSLIPAALFLEGLTILWTTLGGASVAVLLTWFVQSMITSRRAHGRTLRLRPNQRM